MPRICRARIPAAWDGDDQLNQSLPLPDWLPAEADTGLSCGVTM